MNRQEEYGSLLAELENTPPALEYAVSRAQARAKKSRRMHRLFSVPLSSIAVFFITFVVMVNVSTTFAMACGRIPVLRELAAAVAFSPSLSAAVENEYVQPMNLEQSSNNITMRVEYVIVDQKQLNIFYSLHSPVYSQMSGTAYVCNADGTPLEKYSLHPSDSDEKNGELRQFTLDFSDPDMPGSLIFTCEVHENGIDLQSGPVLEEVEQAEEYEGPTVISTFSFTLTFDPVYMQQGETITLNQRFMLDGQLLTATTVEVYPTHIRLNFTDDPSNTAWLQSLGFYLKNEKGERFEAIGNGITAAGSLDSPMMVSHRLESSFFSQSSNLTLYITEAVWQDKEMQRVKIDLANGVAGTLPEGVALEQATRSGSNWQLTFSCVEREKNTIFMPFETFYYDEAGTEYEYNRWSSEGNSYFDEKTERYIETPGLFKVQFSLTDYPYDVVYLSPGFSYTVQLETPVEIKVK